MPCTRLPPPPAVHAGPPDAHKRVSELPIDLLNALSSQPSAEPSAPAPCKHAIANDLAAGSGPPTPPTPPPCTRGSLLTATALGRCGARLQAPRASAPRACSLQPVGAARGYLRGRCYCVTVPYHTPRSDLILTASHTPHTLAAMTAAAQGSREPTRRSIQLLARRLSGRPTQAAAALVSLREQLDTVGSSFSTESRLWVAGKVAE